MDDWEDSQRYQREWEARRQQDRQEWNARQDVAHNAWREEAAAHRDQQKRQKEFEKAREREEAKNEAKRNYVRPEGSGRSRPFPEISSSSDLSTEWRRKSYDAFSVCASSNSSPELLVY